MEGEKKEVPEKNIYSVSDLNLYVKSLLRRDDEIQDVWVKGEISNFTHHEGKHMYFVLKDEKSEIDCAMFRSHNKDIDFEPEEGMKVLCRGDVGLYIPRGQYQLVIKEMMVGGIGELYLAYEQLKERLEEEGLFEEEHKKELPFLPKKVGIVTSEEGAALQDMMRILQNRFENIDIILAPALVQGEGSAQSIVSAIRRLDDRDLDVIIVGRGGGSIEDLWSFNEEKVARAIFDAETPIVSAVGHETDFLISDFVADERAPTPTGAAEIVVPKRSELEKKLEEHERRAMTALSNIIQGFKERLNKLKRRPVFQKPEILLEEKYQRLDKNFDDLLNNIKNFTRESRQRLKGQKERLEALGPLQTMERGYSIVVDEDGEVITSVAEIEKGDFIEVDVKDGKIEGEAKEVERCQNALKE
ncbi:MAG: exodeoxyribonuclease VII large subunit [Candidatus Thermoplasmatota archaeon]|nr:exodeoxyribonuclease VII large subunit [Candidatus Thermoplasmatota archaeon]